jgi:Domain of unknown function (DUF4331)
VFSFVFSESNGGAQAGTVYFASGSQALDPEPAGDLLIAGTPVGFDAMATAVEAGPCRLFIGVRSDPFFADGEGAFHDFQFTGDDAFAGKNVLSMALEVPNDMLGAVRRSEPGRHRASKLLESRGYAPDEARETALTVLPDILHYDRNRPAHYPNGRVLTDDVYDVRMAFLTHGRVTSDGVAPHDDYLTEFPFLGPPHAQASDADTSGGVLGAST